MTGLSALQVLLGTILERGARLVDWRSDDKCDPEMICQLCEELLSSKGEATGIALAAQILRIYDGFDLAQKKQFFISLEKDFDLDAAKVSAAAQVYGKSADAEHLHALLDVAEPRRQGLFRRLNQTAGGTAALVKMRSELLQMIKSQPSLARIDVDFAHLFGSWFNRGFLVMRPINWRTPANILEKIIQYEAVHEITSWDDLRARLEPTDRRCFGFFHPSMPEDPLIFVEVALCAEIPSSIGSVLSNDRVVLNAEQASTAVFYSISNCQSGLKGVSFGSFLIKQVAEDLGRALGNLTTFVTLSPVPGFKAWLQDEAQKAPKGDAAKLLAKSLEKNWIDHGGEDSSLKERIMEQAAQYFLKAKTKDGQPLDPVARFHLGNGAKLDRLNWPGDVSARGLSQSLGLMVNYRYDLAKIETNHEAYAERREIIAARTINALVPASKNS